MKTAILLGIIFCSLIALSQQNGDQYTVAKGDSVATICQKFHISTEELLTSNPGLNPSRLWVGQRVKIPKKSDGENLASRNAISRADSTSQESKSATKDSADKRESSPMYPITAQDKAFLERIQKAVLTNDVEWLSGVVSYPIVLKQNDKGITLKNSDDFKKYSASILTPYLKSAVQNQSPDSLFKNWRGVMIGNGVIWFSGIKEQPDEDWKDRIIGINPEDRIVKAPSKPSAENPKSK